VCVIEEGPWIAPDEMEPFSFEEMRAKYRHRGLTAALGRPGIAYAEGRCVGGSTEINSGLYRRLPDELAAKWRERYRIAEFTPEILDHYASLVEAEIQVSTARRASAVVGAHRARRDQAGGLHRVRRSSALVRRAGQQADMAAPSCARRRAGAPHRPRHRSGALLVDGGRAWGVACGAPSRRTWSLRGARTQVIVCGGAIQTRRSCSERGSGGTSASGLEFHPTIKEAARFPHPVTRRRAHAQVTEFPATSPTAVGQHERPRGVGGLRRRSRRRRGARGGSPRPSTTRHTLRGTGGCGGPGLPPGCLVPPHRVRPEPPRPWAWCTGELLFAPAPPRSTPPSRRSGPRGARRLVSGGTPSTANRVKPHDRAPGSTVRMGENDSLAAADSSVGSGGREPLCQTTPPPPHRAGVNPQRRSMASPRQTPSTSSRD